MSSPGGLTNPNLISSSSPALSGRPCTPLAGCTIGEGFSQIDLLSCHLYVQMQKRMYVCLYLMSGQLFL